MSELWIPIAFLFFVFVGSVIVTYILHLTKVKKIDMVVKLAENGGEVKPEMLALLSKESSGPTSDLRKGLIWIALGIPITLGLLVQGDLSTALFGTVPLFIGVAYLIVRKFGYQEEGSPSDLSLG